MIKKFYKAEENAFKWETSVKIVFFLFFSPFFSAQALSYGKSLQKNSLKSFYAEASSFSLKDIGFLKKDSEYYIQPLTPRIYLIVSEEFTDFLEQWSKYRKKIDHQLSPIFELNPYFRKNYLFFSSSRKQISNALATVYPFPFIQIYPSGSVDFIDIWSLFSWPQDTLLHEMTHIYQMSQNSKWDRVLWPFLGSFSYRNFLLPSWILEGSAVLTESSYGSGGRLFSGFARAFVFSQLKEGLSLKRLLKPYDDSFSSLEKYLHGAYFFSYLHSQFGWRKIKKLFHESSRFLPLDYYGLNNSLERTFEQDLLTLFEKYEVHYGDLAKEQNSSLEPSFAKSKVYAPLNSDKNSIYFLTSDSKSPAELIVFNKKTRAIKKSRKNLPVGKVFYKEGKYYSSASVRTSSTSVEYSLVKEGFRPIEKYNSQNVMDFYKGKALAIDARQSHAGNFLIIDKVFYDAVDSSVLADSKGALYYFKQEGEYRTLYKNQKALVQFKSYFSYPVEVNEQAVYFIGATKYGSSLFVYEKDSDLYRLSESDTVVSARQIDGHRFLVSEVTPTHYEYKVIETKKRKEKPVLYLYSFQKENIFLNPEKQEPVKRKNQAMALERDFLEENFKPYRPFRLLSLSQIYFFYVPEIQIKEFVSHSFSAFFQFLDPLQQNQLLLFGRWDKENQFIKTSYSYQKYRPSFEFSFLYDESLLDFKRDKYLIQTLKEISFLDKKDIFYPVGKFLRKKNFLFQRVRELSLSISYPVSIDSESKLSFISQFGVGGKEFDKNEIWKNYISQIGQLKYQFKRKYSQAYSYHKKRELSVLYNFLHFKDRNQNSYSLLDGALFAGLTEELGQECFLSLKGKFLLHLWNRKPYTFKKKASSWTYPEFKLSLQNLYQGDIELLKVINYSYYPLKLPIALRRMSPLIGLSFLTAQDFDKGYRSFFIPFAGLEGELSVLHEKWIVKLGLAFENRIELFKSYKDSKFQLSFWLKSEL